MSHPELHPADQAISRPRFDVGERFRFEREYFSRGRSPGPLRLNWFSMKSGLVRREFAPVNFEVITPEVAPDNLLDFDPEDLPLASAVIAFNFLRYGKPRSTQNEIRLTNSGVVYAQQTSDKSGKWRKAGYFADPRTIANETYLINELGPEAQADHAKQEPNAYVAPPLSLFSKTDRDGIL